MSVLKKMPNMSEEAGGYLAVVKRMLAECVQQGESVIPMHAILTLNPETVKATGQSQYMVVPQWEQGHEKEKAGCLQKFADLCTKVSECVILAGCGTSYQPKIGTAASLFLFVSIYLPGYEPWTTGVTYAVFDQDIVYGDAYNSTDHVLEPFALPKMWPDINNPEPTTGAGYVN